MNAKNLHAEEKYFTLDKSSTRYSN